MEGKKTLTFYYKKDNYNNKNYVGISIKENDRNEILGKANKGYIRLDFLLDKIKPSVSNSLMLVVEERELNFEINQEQKKLNNLKNLGE